MNLCIMPGIQLTFNCMESYVVGYHEVRITLCWVEEQPCLATGMSLLPGVGSGDFLISVFDKRTCTQ